MKCRRYLKLLLIPAALLASLAANASLIGFGMHSGNNVNDCTNGNVVGCVNALPGDIPNPVSRNPNDGILLVWEELQNFTLTEDIRVDRVADPSADFIVQDASGYLIKAGTIVSSHYIQWDPRNPRQGTQSRVDTSLIFDSDIFAFITSDQGLFDSDYLGLPGLNYNDFNMRGLENNDTTAFGTDPTRVDISWFAGSPGDWTRLLTAYSPQAAEECEINPGLPTCVSTSVPSPGTLLLALTGLGLLGMGARQRTAR